MNNMLIDMECIWSPIIFLKRWRPWRPGIHPAPADDSQILKGVKEVFGLPAQTALGLSARLARSILLALHS